MLIPSLLTALALLAPVPAAPAPAADVAGPPPRVTTHFACSAWTPSKAGIFSRTCAGVRSGTELGVTGSAWVEVNNATDHALVGLPSAVELHVGDIGKHVRVTTDRIRAGQVVKVASLTMAVPTSATLHAAGSAGGGTSKVPSSVLLRYRF